MNASAEPIDRSARAATSDVCQLEEHLSRLLDAYRSALRTVARLPKLGKLETEIIATTASGTTNNPKKRMLVRAFVRPFVETHIRGKIDALIELLNIEAISLKADDEEATKIAEWIKRLKETREVLLGWARYYRLAAKIPLISVLLPVVGAFLLQLIARSGGWVLFSRNAAILIFYVYVILAPLVMSLGFRVKRAIFCGGVTVPVRLFKATDEREHWKQIPAIDIFDAENQLFECLRVVKPQEFPLDLVFRVIPYMMLVTGIAFFVDELRKVWARGYPTVGSIVGTLGYWLIVALMFYAPVKYYQQRRREKKM